MLVPLGEGLTVTLFADKDVTVRAEPASVTPPCVALLTAEVK